MADSSNPDPTKTAPSVLDQARAASVLKPTQTVETQKVPEAQKLPNGLKELPKVTVTQEFNASGGHKLMVEVEGHAPAYSDWSAYNTLASVVHPATRKLYVGASEYFNGKLPPVFIVQEVTDFQRRRIS